MEIHKDHPLLRRPKTRLGEWFYLNFNFGYVNCFIQVLLVAFNIFMYFVTDHPIHLMILPLFVGIFVLCLVSGNSMKKAKIARLKVIQDIIERNQKSDLGA